MRNLEMNKPSNNSTRVFLVSTSFISILIVTLFVGVQIGTRASFSGAENLIPKYFDSTLPWSYVIDCNSTYSFAYNCTTWQKEFENTNDTTLVELAIDASSDGDHIYWRAGAYDIDTIDDQGRNDLTIDGTKGTILNIDNKDNDKHGFWLTEVDGWTIRGLTFSGEIVADGQAGHESSAIELRDAHNITIEYNTFDKVNGYSIRVESLSNPDTWCTGLKIRYNTQTDAGHNFFSGAGVNCSDFFDNCITKSGHGVDDEQIWLGARSDGNLGSFHNTITWNTIVGGSIAVQLDQYTTNDPKQVQWNTVAFNDIRQLINDTLNNYPVIRLEGNNNDILYNDIIDRDDVKSNTVIQITNDSSTDPCVGNRFIGNTIFHMGTGTGISAYHCQIENTWFLYNRIQGTANGQASINMNNANNDYVVVDGNTVRRTIYIAGNPNGNNGTNFENVADD